MLEKRTDHIGEFLTQPGGKPTWCRVRIYEGEKPLILLSSLQQNRGVSLTNAIEFVSTEVVLEHFPHLTRGFPSIAELLRQWRGLEVPFIVVEHDYIEGPWEDPEDLSFVEFSDVMVRHLGGGVRRFGSFQWKGTSRAEIEQLIGEPI